MLPDLQKQFDELVELISEMMKSIDYGKPLPHERLIELHGYITDCELTVNNKRDRNFLLIAIQHWNICKDNRESSHLVDEDQELIIKLLILPTEPEYPHSMTTPADRVMARENRKKLKLAQKTLEQCLSPKDREFLKRGGMKCG